MRNRIGFVIFGGADPCPKQQGQKPNRSGRDAVRYLACLLLSVCLCAGGACSGKEEERREERTTVLSEQSEDCGTVLPDTQAPPYEESGELTTEIPFGELHPMPFF